MATLNQYLSDSDIEAVHNALEYVLNAYGVDDERSLQALESLRERTAPPAAANLEASQFDIYCAIRILQTYIADMDEEGDRFEEVFLANQALVKLIHASTGGAKFSVDNQGPPLESE